MQSPSVPFVNRTAGHRTAGAVRAELARRRISGRELARGLGWSVPTTWRRLSGTSPFDVNELAAVAAYLGVPVASLVSDEDPAAQAAS
jgi:transcriptional regulator with XRE-family HTH domain